MDLLGLRCCTQALSGCGEWGLLLAAVRGLLNVVASPVVKHGLQARGPQQLQHAGSAVVAHGLQRADSEVVAHGPSCSTARRIFLDQGLIPALAGGLPTTAPPGKPLSFFLMYQRVKYLNALYRYSYLILQRASMSVGTVVIHVL